MNKSLLFIFLICCPIVYSQDTKDQLFEQRKRIKDDIELTNKLIESTKSKKGNTIQSIKLIDQKISSKSVLVANYNAEIKIIEKKINDRERSIKALEVELDKQKRIYAEFLQYAQKHSNTYTNLVFLLAANSFNQFYLRHKYLEQLNHARIEKIKLIGKIESNIKLEIAELEKEKVRIAETLIVLKKESNSLAETRDRRENLLTDLQKEEKELKKKLADKIKIEKELNKKIEEIIRKEAAGGSFAKLTPEERLVSDDFERNKGKLPWPTRQGIITERFGPHPHPVIRGVKVQNNGIDITTVENTRVRAVFNGTVSKIFAIKGSNYTVIVRHGNYYSVYHNLKEVNVKVGDKISTKEELGIVASNADDGANVVHFELWKGLEKMNPELWISD